MQRRRRDPPARSVAAALRYAPPQDAAPRVTAKGRGRIAEKIIALAGQYGIPIQEDPELVEILATLDLQQEIPPECYAAVAEILAFVYSLNQRFLEGQP